MRFLLPSSIFLLFFYPFLVAGWKEPAAYCQKCREHLGENLEMLRGLGHDIAIVFASEGLKSKCMEASLPEKFCSGAANNILPHILEFIDKSDMNADEFCSLLPGCDHPGAPQYSEKYKWTMALPEKRGGKTLPKKKEEKRDLRVLHLADIHIDEEYEGGAEVNCLPETAPQMAKEWFQCCRGKKAEDPSNAAGYWGTPSGACDIPFRTFESALQALKRKEMKFDYILLTGDLISHDVVQYTREMSLSSLRNVTETISWYLPETPIYLTLGNHEAVPVNAFSYRGKDEETAHGWLYDELEEVEKRWISAEQRRSIRSHGSYVATPVEGLKVININNNFCYHLNLFSYLNPVDPGGVLQFLVDELLVSEERGERVHIHAHVPPGSQCLQSWSDSYAAIVERFKETITGMFYGHMHYTQHLLHYDEEGNATHVNWVGPSLTTWSNVNPAFKTYTVDGETFNVKSSTLFHAEVDGVGEHEELEWVETDSAKLYELEDISPSSWQKFFEKMEDSEELRRKYTRSIHRGTKWSREKCDDECARNFICQAHQATRNASVCL